MLGYLLPHLLRSLLTLVLEAILTFLVRDLFTLRYLDMYTLLVWNLLTLLPVLVVSVTLLGVGYFTFLLGLRDTHLLVFCVTVGRRQSLAMLLKLVVDQDILIGDAYGAFLDFLPGRDEDTDRLADSVRDVSAGLLRDRDTMGNLPGGALLLRDLVALLLLHVVALLLRDLDAVLPGMARCLVRGGLVDWLALLPVLSVTHLLLLLVADIPVCGLTLLLVLVLALHIALMLALGAEDVLTLLVDRGDANLHIIVPASTAA